MTPLLLLFLCAAPATSSAKPPPKPLAGDAPSMKSFFPKGAANHSAGDTACAACHTTASWNDVRFNHEKTGFPLRGRHERTSCKSCHPVDFEKTVPNGCVGCHLDGHAGELGARCEGCHDERSWRSAFSADAHRNARFPLVGGHAVLPCQECHLEGAERRFAGPPVECASCHQGDVGRTRGAAVDHQALNFVSGCEQCHNGFRFTPARFPGHDACYVISSGSHANIPCLGCHTSLPPVTPGTCSTRTAACTGCHEHQCSLAGNQTPTDALHAKVPGYQCKDRKCYECHQLPGTR